MLATWGANQGFSPSSLFSAGEPGAWYDPSDLTTLFQDAAGTTPVTAVEQPVGLILDKSKNQALGSELIPALNLTSGWNPIGSLSSSTTNSFTTTGIGGLSSATVNLSTSKSYKIVVNYTKSDASTLFAVYTVGGNALAGSTAASGSIVSYGFPATSNAVYLRLAGAASVTISSITIKEIGGNHAYQSTSASRPVLSARVNLLNATATLSTQSVTTLATDYKLSFSGTGSITLSGTKTGTYTAGSNTLTGVTAGTLTLTVSGSVTSADLRPSNVAVGSPAYQSVTNSTTYDTVGFPYYLKFDGVDDYLATNNIDFTATNKVSVFAGARKLSDAPLGMLAEISSDAGLNGGFYIAAPFAGGGYGYTLGSPVDQVATSSGYVAPLTNVLSVLFDKSGVGAAASIFPRINGAIPPLTVNQNNNASGNFTNFPLFIGRRGGASLPFNGQLYSLIVRGAQSLSGQINNAERYVNSKTKAY